MKKAFILLEAMLAVFIFSIGVLGLAKCVQNCLLAEMAKDEDSRARRCLMNRMAEIEAEAVTLDDKSSSEKLKGEFDGMTLKQSRLELKRKNEKDQDITGLFEVTLELLWKSHGADQSRVLKFYVYPRNS